MHKGSGWGLICIYAKRRMRFGHWQISAFVQRFTANPSAAISSTIGRNGLNRAIFRASLVDRSKRIPRHSRDRYVNDIHTHDGRLGPVATEIESVGFNGIADWKKKGGKKKNAQRRIRARTRARQRPAWVCNVNRYAQKKRERDKRDRERWGRRDLYLNIHSGETYATELRTMGVAREKISYRTLINYTWFWF